MNVRTALSGQTPQRTGTAASPGITRQCDSVNPVYYGQTMPGTAEYNMVVHVGYFRPKTSGTYTITLTGEDEAAYIWYGSTAVSGWTNANANAIGTNYTPGTVTITATAGTVYPFRLVFVNAQGCAIFNFAMTDPSGASATDQLYHGCGVTPAIAWQ